MQNFDIIIVGGGASGLAAAISAARSGGKLHTAVLERLDKTGKKLLATGSGRCNLSNADISPDRYHGSCKSLLGVCSGFDARGFFDTLGLVCTEDEAGRIYPLSFSASSVLDALRLEAKKLGVREICGAEVGGIEKKNGMFTLFAGGEKYSARAVLIACGGMAQPSLGSNGSSFELCRSLGITVKEPYPALTPLKTDAALVRPLKGQRVRAAVSYLSDGKKCGEATGEVQFTEGLLSGICVFDLSGLYHAFPRCAELILDLLPGMSGEEALALLEKIRAVRACAPLEELLSGIMHKRLGTYIIKRSTARALSDRAESLTKSELRALCGTIKALSFPVLGTAGFERAQVTGGGVPADELDGRFGAKKVKGLFICGEALDIYGACGGYNLDLAFASGFFAGKNAAEDLL